jgi:hypothetical protein
MNLAHIVNSALRTAIRRNLVSFPSQIPAFAKDGEEQKRVVQLYFVSGWEIGAICDRYKLSKWTVRTILSDWKVRAVAAGLIQTIDPEEIARLSSQTAVDPDEVFDEPAPSLSFTRIQSGSNAPAAIAPPVSSRPLPPSKPGLWDVRNSDGTSTRC